MKNIFRINTFYMWKGQFRLVETIEFDGVR